MNVSPGDIVLIPAGAKVDTTYHGTRIAKKSYRVKVDHLLRGRDGETIVRWAGRGGYWSETAEWKAQ